DRKLLKKNGNYYIMFPQKENNILKMHIQVTQTILKKNHIPPKKTPEIALILYYQNLIIRRD
uniref:hypothetical protein n=1 Tax=Borreliella bavariensis TaxID=664662 RepID=UPI001CB6DE2E